MLKFFRQESLVWYIVVEKRRIGTTVGVVKSYFEVDIISSSSPHALLRDLNFNGFPIKNFLVKSIGYNLTNNQEKIYRHYWKHGTNRPRSFSVGRVVVT